MKCWLCRRAFKDNDDVIPVLKYIVNVRRGDFVTTQGHAFIHVRHLLNLDH